jgi:hypothetical protein
LPLPRTIRANRVLYTLDFSPFARLLAAGSMLPYLARSLGTRDDQH